jgi:plasmid stability protein
MSRLIIKKPGKSLERKLRKRAAKHGRSIEEEALEILRSALGNERDRPENLWDAIRSLVEPLGGVDLELAPRESIREPPSLD